MRFDANVSASANAGRVVGRITGSYLREVAAETRRIIAASPEHGVDEITAEVMEVLRSRGITHADPVEVRKAVGEVREATR